MNRLTNKNMRIMLSRNSGKTLFNKIYRKLDKLEDIEQDLGCPLEVVIKLIGSNIILNGEPCYVMGILKDGDNLCIHYSKCYEAYDDIEPLKNYGKTFWIYEEDKTE